MKQKAIKKDTKILRVMNWVFSFALIFGSLMVIFQAT